jgi:hypothetical protein
LAGAARYYGVSATTIKRSELESEVVQKVLRKLKQTGRVELKGDDLRNQKPLTPRMTSRLGPSRS